MTDLAHEVAEYMVAVLIEEPGPVAVALSGGSTPKMVYELLVTEPFVHRLPWDRVHWFWGDERFVPQDDPRSNYRMTMTAMLAHAPVPEGFIHPVPTEGLSPEQAAAAYQAELEHFHGSARLDRPLFQLVLLGLGTNGHTASLFPDTPVLAERSAWVAPVTPAGEPTRITLTYPALESCRNAAFIVAGADKRDVLARVRGQRDPSLPASNYHPAGKLRWFTDAEAAGT